MASLLIARLIGRRIADWEERGRLRAFIKKQRIQARAREEFKTAAHWAPGQAARHD